MAKSKFLTDGSIRESHYQRELMKTLRKLPNCFPMRLNVGIFNTGDGRYVNTGIPEGCSDIIVYIAPGITVFVELKSKKGKLRPKQELFRDVVQALGFIYMIIKTDLPIESAVEKIFLEASGRLEKIKSESLCVSKPLYKGKVGTSRKGSRARRSAQTSLAV